MTWFHGANFTRAPMSGVRLTGHAVREGTLTGADLGRADLAGAQLRGVDPSGANLEGAHLGQANLRHADLTGARRARADLAAPGLEAALLDGADLSEVCLVRAVLVAASLCATDLTSADLRPANLSEANVSRALLTHAGSDRGAAGGRGGQPDRSDLRRPAERRPQRGYPGLPGTNRHRAAGRGDQLPHPSGCPRPADPGFVHAQAQTFAHCPHNRLKGSGSVVMSNAVF